jgi:hypothetical protein
MDEDNDARFPDDSPVLVRYPRNKRESHSQAVAGEPASVARAAVRTSAHHSDRLPADDERLKAAS